MEEANISGDGVISVIQLSVISYQLLVKTAEAEGLKYEVFLFSPLKRGGLRL